MTKQEREKLRRAVADYMWSEGCACCRNTLQHDRHLAVLGELLKVEKYSDGSGYNFGQYRTLLPSSPKGE